MMMPRIRRTARIADIAATVPALSHPLTHRVPATVITHNLIDCENRPSAGRVTDNPAGAVIASPVRLRV